MANQAGTKLDMEDTAKAKPIGTCHSMTLPQKIPFKIPSTTLGS